jgi:hypothetical protein
MTGTIHQPRDILTSSPVQEDTFTQGLTQAFDWPFERKNTRHLMYN